MKGGNYYGRKNRMDRREYEKINKRLEAVGMPQFIIDEENMMVYKDDIHKLLGIGVKLES